MLIASPVIVQIIACDTPFAIVRASAEPVRDELWALPLAGGAPQPISRNADTVFYANFGDSSRVYSFLEGTPGGEHRFGVRSVDGSVNIEVPSVAEAPSFKAKCVIAYQSRPMSGRAQRAQYVVCPSSSCTLPT